MGTSHPFLIGTLDLIKKAGHDARIVHEGNLAGGSPHSASLTTASYIEFTMTYHEDEHCQLVWLIYVDDREIRLVDSAGGVVKSWDLCDPKCFDHLLEELNYLGFSLRDALAEVYPQAKAKGVLPQYPK